MARSDGIRQYLRDRRCKRILISPCEQQSGGSTGEHLAHGAYIGCNHGDLESERFDEDIRDKIDSARQNEYIGFLPSSVPGTAVRHDILMNVNSSGARYRHLWQKM